MLDKSKLGNRYTCYECGTKFYDLNREAAMCPECNADQANAPVRDIRSLLSRNSAGNRPEVQPEAAPVEEVEAKDENDETEDDEFDVGDMDLGLNDIDDSDDNEMLEDLPSIEEMGDE
tara:strand:- start:40 stop:393 length:354 start_codon:yes stop_codon:yes gene_type:complete